MSDTEDIIRKYWDDLPREMRIELIQDSANTQTILQRAARELDVEISTDSNSGHVKKEQIAEFVVGVMEKHR